MNVTFTDEAVQSRHVSWYSVLKMPIKVTDNQGKTTDTYVNRTLQVRHFKARRNMSDTLDYSDFQDVECCEALVWTGPTDLAGQDISFEKQFVWLDCSNHFRWRGEDFREPVVDATLSNPACDPLMWANKMAWESYERGQAERRLREAEEEVARRKVKQAAYDAAAVVGKAKELAAKAAAEAQLATLPKKGTQVKVLGQFTGKVFWMGAVKFRGKWQAKVGVKNAAGAVAWAKPHELSCC